MTPVFTFSNLKCCYGKKTVLKNISSSIYEGTLTSLIGPNGSGKSTMLRTLAGLQKYDGVLKLNGRDLKTLPRRDFGHTVGIVPQQMNLKTPFSVYEVIALGRLPYQSFFAPSNTDDDIIADSAERADVAHLLCRRVTELSGGEKQRVLFAMVMAQNPDVYLLDEPTSALDPSSSIRIFSILKELTEEGKSVIVAAHDINMSIPFSNRYISLRGGEIIAEGEASSLDENILNELYETSFVQYTSDGGDTAWHPKRC